MYDQDTISAISTPPGSGAIALLRSSGPEALKVLRSVAPALPPELLARKAYFVPLQDAEGRIDEAVITFYPAPHSYTGEHVVEVSVHGSTYVQQRLLEAMLRGGSRLAKPGEFTQRAYLNLSLIHI